MNSRSGYLYLLAVSSLVFAPVASADSSGVVTELKTCARIVERDARVDCYEALGRRVLEGEGSEQVSVVAEQVAEPVKPADAVVTATVAASAAAPSGNVEMDDHMGGYKFEEKPSDHPDNAIHAKVTLCQQDRDKVWFFKFENGQVWKQVDRVRLNFQGCDFPVTILKDGFGYKMQIEGSERQIRISRQK